MTRRPPDKTFAERSREAAADARALVAAETLADPNASPGDVQSAKLALTPIDVPAAMRGCELWQLECLRTAFRPTSDPALAARLRAVCDEHRCAVGRSLVSPAVVTGSTED